MFHEMRYIYQVYKEKSFSKAAKKLYISQPSLSLMVKKAEERLGTPLFDRSISPIRLTPAGEEYIRSVEQIMAVEDHFRQYLSSADDCLTGTLSLGGTTFFTSYVLPPLISEFSTRFPGVEILIHETHTALLEKELQEGSLDFAIENYAFDPALFDSRPYLSDRLVLVVPAGFDINRQARPYQLTAQQISQGVSAPCVPLSLFAGEPFLLLKEGNDTRLRAGKLCAQAGFHPHARLLLDQQITAYNLSSYGLGISFISDTLIRSVPPTDSLCFYYLDSALAQRHICLFSKKNRFMSRPMQEFLKLL